MNKLKLGWFLVVMTLGFHVAQSQLPYHQVINRYKNFLIELDTTSTQNVKNWLATLDQNGKWPDVDYADQNSSAWKTTEHLDRIVKISIAYQKTGNRYYQNTLAGAVISRGINHWLNNLYRNPNWWYNEIGIPQFWRDIITLDGDFLEAELCTKALNILRQFKIRPNFTGANLTWSADLSLHYGLFSRNDSLVSQASKLLAKEIKVSSGEGIMPDYSYHQHGNRLQTHHYGAAFIKENIRLAYELDGTPWAFPAEKVVVMKDFLLDGWQWMERGIFLTPGSVDRAVSRKGFLKQDISRLILYLSQLNEGYRSLDLDAMFRVQQGGKQNLKGFRYFPFSDFSAYQQPGFSFFLKTISTKTEVAERINGENHKGAFLNLGNTYFIRNGKEYTDLMPFWDWNKLPGVTNFKSANSFTRSNFAGGVEGKGNGFAVMDLESTGADSKLSASKFWAMHKGRVFCLIGDITLTGSTDSIFTTLEQSRMQPPLFLNAVNNIPSTNVSARPFNWIHHHGITYVPLTGGLFDLSIGGVKGSWSDISKSGSKDIGEEKVFKVVLHHHNHTSAVYMVDGVTQPDLVQKKIDRPDWQILQNTKLCQAISFNDGIMMASFHQKGTSKFAKRLISVDRACLVLIDSDKIYASDPLKTGGKLEIQINGKKLMLDLPADGTTINQNL
ncbi:polysaccharide lyase family 8 super-sandwich domain-containing protein [Pedobacter agri]|uniref:polysaccharide lyase family 8 super-sandwich domain-containing protein n=1 Tax=Pedobacter agri TaxID=454586 RepID=UPI000E2562CA|nr:polysaccharide lyase family 8 super-sandwich domain-containing protein [Pedobacter agri]MDQ1142618.1 chondroitin AC lyase [Pedobacter agri]